MEVQQQNQQLSPKKVSPIAFLVSYKLVCLQSCMNREPFDTEQRDSRMVKIASRYRRYKLLTVFILDKSEVPKKVIRRSTPVKRKRPVQKLSEIAPTQKEVVVEKQDDQFAQYEKMPQFARPFKKDGKWIIRPTIRPKSFQEILEDPLHLDFFKRYLHAMGGDTPLLFWEAVEQLKTIKEARLRHHHLTTVFKRFFLNKTSKC